MSGIVRKSNLQEGDVVDIYQDPITKQSTEGKAKLVEFHSAIQYSTIEWIERWTVQFLADEPGDTYFRNILVGSVSVP